jgi:group II intron reverse transcriptase/maturase
MKTEYLKEENCPQRDSTEYKEYAEVLSIYLPEDMERGRELQSEHLMEEAVTPKNMEIAMKRVRANNGAPGADGKTVRETIEWMNGHFAEVQAEMMGGYYHPTAVRRRVIPKPDGGERKLGIPTAKDRIVQQAIAQILVPLYEPQFSDNSFGYRPGRSGQQAIERVKEYAEVGYEWAVVLDLSKYFDTLNHDRLIRELRKTVKDEAMMKLIKKFLKAGVMENGVVIETTEGSPQGGLCRAPHNPPYVEYCVMRS